MVVYFSIIIYNTKNEKIRFLKSVLCLNVRCKNVRLMGLTRGTSIIFVPYYCLSQILSVLSQSWMIRAD